MNNEPSLELDQLETHIQMLVEKIHQLRADNGRLNTELTLSRQDFAIQSKELEAERNKSPMISTVTNDSELYKTVEHQAQEIQLLEKERLNLRDQIAFLQNTIQTKEKDWKNKSEHAHQELNQQLHSAQQQLLHSQERVNSLEFKLQVLQTDAEQANHVLEEHKTQTALLQSSLKTQTDAVQTLEQQLTETKSALQEQDKKTQTQLTELKNRYEAQILQEKERFRTEFALLNQRHEQNLSNLTQALNHQKELLKEEVLSTQKKLQQSQLQNQTQRVLLAQTAADIRTILSRLPLPEDENTPTLNEDDKA